MKKNKTIENGRQLSESSMLIKISPLVIRKRSSAGVYIGKFDHPNRSDLLMVNSVCTSQGLCG